MKLRRVVQIVSEFFAKPFHEIRVLDLACMEGLYAVEFARHGADVVAIEGREENIVKAEMRSHRITVAAVKGRHRNLISCLPCKLKNEKISLKNPTAFYGAIASAHFASLADLFPFH